MQNKIMPFLLSLTLAGAGCASFGQGEKTEEVSETNNKLLRETEYRLSSLENSVSALNSQLAQLNNRIYEVRTVNGKKTSMKVVPVSAQSASPAAATSQNDHREIQVRQSAASKLPAGRKIDPASQPAPLAAKGVKTPTAPAPGEKKAGPAGRLGASPAGSPDQAATHPENDTLELPPTGLPVAVSPGTALPVTPIAESSQASQGTASSPPGLTQEILVPVPSMQDNGLALPPEVGQAEGAHQKAADMRNEESEKGPASGVPRATAGPAPAQKGEEAAYKAALNLVRSGKTAQGLAKFREFMSQYPNGKYAANAEYWIGECLYAQGNYKDALEQFQAVNNSFPAHHKNADALLKSALTLSRLGDKAAANDKIKTLLASFPQSDAARRARSMGNLR